jgi:hypothetical protein
MTWGLVFFRFPKNYIFGRDKGVCEKKNPHTYLTRGLNSKLSD